MEVSCSPFKPLLGRSRLAGLVCVEGGVAVGRCHDITSNPGEEGARPKAGLIRLELL